MFDRTGDARIRASAFAWLEQQVAAHGDVLPRDVLTRGFELSGQRVPLLGPQGIFKPAVMSVPLSIATVPSGPYDDGFDADGILHYRYRGTDPSHRDNAGLRFAMETRLPLVYFHRVITSRYVAAWPVLIVADRPEKLSFEVQVEDVRHLSFEPESLLSVADPASAEARRRYITSVVRVRLHQRTFRERVLAAYQRECAFCRFKHDELLEAAHITADADPLGEPVVSNGLSLCRLHHGAFDKHFVAVRPDLTIEVRPDLLTETDGPTLIHGIQRLHGISIRVPRDRSERPSVERLTERYDSFLERAWRVS